MLSQKHRFKQRADITQVLRSGQRLNSPLLSLVYQKSGDEKKQDWRLAVIAGKKSVSLLAAARNQAKRQIGNAFYQLSKEFQLNGLDFVILAKKPVVASEFVSIRQELNKLLRTCLNLND